MRLPASIAAGGSTNSVAPLDDVSCTMPPSVARPSRRTGITCRPLRSVTDASSTRCFASSFAIRRSSRRTSSDSAPRSSLRSLRSVGDASSRTTPSSFTIRSIIFSTAASRSSMPAKRWSGTRAPASRVLSVNAMCVSRDDTSSVWAPRNSSPVHAAPSMRKRARAVSTSGIVCDVHPASLETRARIASTRACSAMSSSLAC